MALRARWTRLEFAGDRFLVYSAAWGRSYVLESSHRDDSALLRLLGLRPEDRRDHLPDPATSVLTARELAGAPAAEPSRGDLALYRLLHHSRSVVPLACIARCLTRRAALSTARIENSVVTVGARLDRVERAVGFSDCYPRALLTARLCSQLRLPFQLAIGALIPTRMMHAWCSVDGCVPYEPMPEHWIYQPALILESRP
jgi:hypothetical protein